MGAPSASSSSLQSLWSNVEHKLFESALSQSGSGELDWEAFRSYMPGKKTCDLKQHFDMLVQDVASIEAGLVPLPNYVEPSPSSEESGGSPRSRKAYKSTSEQERRKGIPWSTEEHELFLLGLEKFGKGDWRSISRNFVVTRTPTQVASHAQKYFLRRGSNQKDKRRNSIHDITCARPSILTVQQQHQQQQQQQQPHQFQQHQVQQQQLQQTLQDHQQQHIQQALQDHQQHLQQALPDHQHQQQQPRIMHNIHHSPTASGLPPLYPGAHLYNNWPVQANPSSGTSFVSSRHVTPYLQQPTMHHSQ